MSDRAIARKEPLFVSGFFACMCAIKHLRCADTHLGAWLGLASEGRLLDLLEADNTTVSGVDGVVAAHVRARAGNLCSACLANEDLTSVDSLATEALDAKARPSVIVDVLA